MSLIVVDVETDGQVIGKNSMICFGAVIVDKNLDKTFYGECKPEDGSTFVPEALAVSGFSREQTLQFANPVETMNNFAKWLSENSIGKPTLISDNNGFDASWINYYFHVYYGSNPFGWSSRRIGDLFCGFMNNPFYNWKRHRKTKHTHNPVDDAMGNAEAIKCLINKGFNLKLK
jgi:hypothetical protein